MSFAVSLSIALLRFIANALIRLAWCMSLELADTRRVVAGVIEGDPAPLLRRRHPPHAGAQAALIALWIVLTLLSTQLAFGG